MASIGFKHVSKIYSKGEVAVNNLSLEIKDKEFLVLVGPSGCGKSTTLRMIAGLESVDKGDLYIDETRVNDIPPKDRNISIVFQNYALYPHMTAYENLAFGLKVKKVPKQEIGKKVLEAAQILEIEELLDKKPKEMSGGQRQRVAIGRAIVRNPGVFLFDEPLSNLDAKLRGVMRSEIAKLHKRLNTTMVYVTHDQVEAMTLGDRIVVMNKGVIQQAGTPSELYNNPENLFVAGFIGSPPMNFFKGSIKSENGLYIFIDNNNKVRIQLQDVRSEDSEVTLGVRAEDFSILDDNDTDSSYITGKLSFIEKLGHENFLFLDIDGIKITMRSLPSESKDFTEGQMVKIKTNRYHLFDSLTGERKK